MEILQVENLTFSYMDTPKPVLENISFSVTEGEFVVLCGKTGCGKTTLLRLLKKELMPYGKKQGRVLYRGKDLVETDARTSASEIGFVMQKPEQQIVTDKVWHEMAFGLENLLVPSEKIRRRICEMASYFGISQWFYKDVWELSGGQKQMLNLASVMAMNPKVLLLDEPASQLDPIAVADLIGTIRKLNREFGLTVLMIEHHLDEVFPDADKVILLDQGKLFACGSPREVLWKIRQREDFMEAMPMPARLCLAFQENVVSEKNCPLTIREGKTFVENHFKAEIKKLSKENEIKAKKEKALELKEVYFRYSPHGKEILQGTEFQVEKQEIFCILGGNGSGKTTALKVASGLLKAYSGTVKVMGKKIQSYKNGSLYDKVLAILPQETENVFTGDTLLEDFMNAFSCKRKEELMEILSQNFLVREEVLPMEELLPKHPYDLSGGQQQICALIKVLRKEPSILLLDEPAKGMDAYAKKKLTRILKDLKEKMTIVVVTHDIEFAAVTADRCGLFFNGEMISVDKPDVFFSENTFYTTAMNRMTRNHYENIVQLEDAKKICLLNGWIEK